MSRKTKIEAEEKIRVAKACSKGSMSISAAAEEQGVHPSVVSDWVRQYETEGGSAFLPQRENRQYDPILKEAAVKDYLSGKGSLLNICRRYKIRDKKTSELGLRFIIRDRNDNPLVFDTLDAAIQVNPNAHPLFHSDRGFQYANRTFITS